MTSVKYSDGVWAIKYFYGNQAIWAIGGTGNRERGGGGIVFERQGEITLKIADIGSVET